MDTHRRRTAKRPRHTVGNLVSCLVISLLVVCGAYYLFVAIVSGNVAWPVQGWPLGG